MFFFFKQKTAYEMRISDWSSDVCSSDLRSRLPPGARQAAGIGRGAGQPTDDEPVGKCTDYARTGQHDGRDDRHLLRQLSRPSDSGHAGYRRHVRRRAWLSTALVLERASWGALLPTDPYLRHRDRQAGGHAAAHRQDAFWKGGGGAHPTPGASPAP